MPKLSATQKVIRTHQMRERLRAGMIELIRVGNISEVTMDMLAETLQVAKGSIYNYYPNKTALVNDALLAIDCQVIADIEELAQENADPAAKLKEFAAYILNHFSRYRNVYAAFYDPGAQSQQHRQTHCEHSERMRKIFAGELQRGIDDGRIKNRHEAQELSVAVYGTLVGMVRLLYFSRMPYSAEQCSEIFNRTIIDELFGRGDE